MGLPGTAVAYYRIATTHQPRSGLGIETQRAMVTRFAEAEELAIIAELVEVGRQGCQAWQSEKHQPARFLAGSLGRLVQTTAANEFAAGLLPLVLASRSTGAVLLKAITSALTIEAFSRCATAALAIPPSRAPPGRCAPAPP